MNSVEATRLRLSDSQAAALAKHDITSVAGVLLNHPISWHGTDTGDLVSGKIRSVAGGEKPFIVVESSGSAWKGAWLGQPWAVLRLRVGQQVVMWGKRSAHGVWYNPEVEVTQPPPPSALGAVWRRRGRVTSRILRATVGEALRRSRPIPDPLNGELIDRRELMTRDRALVEIAFPSSRGALNGARRRLVYDEFMRIMLTAPEPEKGRAVPWSEPPPLPFALTAAQCLADKEIAEDQSSLYRMSRLLHGDVGSGKTAVAALAAARAAAAGLRTVVMAPTDILARQLHRKMGELGAVETRLEVSGMYAGEKRAQNPDAAVVVGTHALLFREAEPDVGLVVVDEQHRFGVNHRRKLLETYPGADRLIMSATPIPRSLSQTMYGDMKVSTLDEMPPGVRPSVTRRMSLSQAVGRLAAAAAAGRPSFVVCPKIERGKRAGWSVDAVAEALREKAGGLRCEVVTGKVRPGPRQKALERLNSGETDVLVATTVVEVGLDVPKAAVMAVMDPHRFGLAQLHQLRGRVGRGEGRSEFLLVEDRAEGDDNPLREGAEERLEAVCSISDGFRLARVDLSMRGPGQSWGEAQSGGMGLARPVEDEDILAAAAADAAEVGDEMRSEAEALLGCGGWAARDF